MNALKDIDEYVQKGYAVSYDIVNQIENGYEAAVKNGSMKLYTYTFYVYLPNKVDFEDCFSFDCLDDGFKEALEYFKHMEDIV